MTWLDCNTEKQGVKKVIAELKCKVCTVDKSEAERISVTIGLLEPTQYELAMSVTMHETVIVSLFTRSLDGALT